MLNGFERFDLALQTPHGHLNLGTTITGDVELLHRANFCRDVIGMGELSYARDKPAEEKFRIRL